MNIRTELYALAQRAAKALPLPALASALITDPQPAPDRNTEFGLLALADGCAGLYYAWLGDSQADMPARFQLDDLLGRPALELARYVLGDDDGTRSLGIAAINAITEHVYRKAGFAPAAATDSFGGVVLEAGDRLGMIGHFPPLARRARELGITTRIVERKAHMVTVAPNFEISLDPGVLRDCNKIICTGATLLNDSFDAMLEYCAHAEQIALVGPTVGFFPDAVFARGIDIVAGTRLLDSAQAQQCLTNNQKLTDCSVRTVLHRAEYPGFETLLARAVARSTAPL
jgi:uncharacterized protein (DUF4213/DUF364 family)